MNIEIFEIWPQFLAQVLSFYLNFCELFIYLASIYLDYYGISDHLVMDKKNYLLNYLLSTNYPLNLGFNMQNIGKHLEVPKVLCSLHFSKKAYWHNPIIF